MRGGFEFGYEDVVFVLVEDVEDDFDYLVLDELVY